MPLQRKMLSEHEYRGHKIVVRHMGPDCLCEVDGDELSGFYLDVKSGRSGGERYVNFIIKSQEDDRRRK